MALPKALPASRLVATLPAEKIRWKDSNDIPRSLKPHPPQPRALKALELALHIDASGYNIYLSGGSSLGRIYMLREFLEPKARKMPTPPDLLYVNNFEDPDKPYLIEVPAGCGSKIRHMLHTALATIRRELPQRLEHENYAKKRAQLFNQYQDERSLLLRQMERSAERRGFSLEMDDQGNMTLYPLVDGKRLGESEFESLEPAVRQALKNRGDTVLTAMTGLVRKLSKVEKVFRTDEKGMEQEQVHKVLESTLVPMIERITKLCPENTLLTAYLTALHSDIKDNPEQFLSREGILSALGIQTGSGPSSPAPQTGSLDSNSGDDQPNRYEVNVLVDNSQLKGAPIIIDDHPTQANLLGCIEREAEMGALVTDFTLIKSGSLHKANGGFLVLRLEDVLQHSGAWEGLMRALRSGLVRLDDHGENSDSANRTKSIEPEALKLSLKVILVGNEDLYESLIEHDDRFPKLFKIKAQLTQTTERDAAGIRNWVLSTARIIDEAKLLPFSREAIAGLVDYGSRLCEDQRKLSLKFPQVRDMMIEASALASMAKASMVERHHLDEALAGRTYRANLVEEIYMEEYDRDLIKVRTSGSAIGRVNGLSVTWYGDFEFGLPHQISCTVGVGRDGIIDLEREAELGGPIHTKAMLILKSYLVDQFAKDKPLVMTGSLCFEQNYGGVEGDSASGAELAALLSAIAEVPLNLSLAFTGAVSQSGQIMAVGGVTRKIEGFFEVCSRRGLTGKQGVIIPHDNVDHLMLSPRIIEAVDKGRFAVYPVRHITEALELLTGLPAGKARKRNGKHSSFTPGSLYDLVDKRLKELGLLADKPSRRKR